MPVEHIVDCHRPSHPRSLTATRPPDQPRRSVVRGEASLVVCCRMCRAPLCASRTIRPAGPVDPVRNAPIRHNSAGPASELLEDEHPVGRDADLDPAAAGGHVGAEVADVVAAVDRRVAVEDLAPEAVRQPRWVGLDDVAVEEGLVPEAGDDEQSLGAGEAGEGDQAVGPEGVDDVDVLARGSPGAPAEADEVLVEAEQLRAGARAFGRRGPRGCS